MPLAHRRFSRLAPALAPLLFAALAHAQPGQDLTFGVSGLTRVGSPTTNERWNDVLLQPDGKVLVAGAANTPLFGGPGNLILARYLSSGTLDSSFASGGTLSLPLSNAKSIALQPDGKVLVAGDASLATQTIPGLIISQSLTTPADIHIARLNPDGTLDTTFGSGGLVRTDFTTSRIDTVERLLLLPGGRIWAIGAASSARGESVTNWAITAYTPTGTLDSSFGSGGRLEIDFNQPTLSASPFDAVLLNNTVVIVGTSGENLVAARVNATTGALDPTFGSGGLTQISLQIGLPSTTLRATSVLPLPDGRLFINGNFTFFDSDPGEISPTFSYATRLTPSGLIDPTFNAFPIASLLSSPGASARLLGTRVILSVNSSRLIRLNDNGSLDTTLGIFRPLSPSAYILDNLAVQPDGQLLMAGASLFAAPSPIINQTDASIIRINLGATPPPPCRIDFDNNTLREPADIFAFLNAYFSPTTPVATIDFDCNAVRTPADIFAFLNNYFANNCTPCP